MESVTEQVRSPHAGEYLTIQQLADSLGLDVKTVQNKMNQGVFQRGVHWFRPQGTHPRFKWSAIVIWLEEKDHLAEVDIGTVTSDIEIPMSRGYLLRNGR